jgi:hypothetical protein
MTYKGTVKNGVVVLPPEAKIPDGTEVRVEPVEELPTWGEVFKDLIGSVEGLPSDLAENHDHYAHGAPKR